MSIERTGPNRIYEPQPDDRHLWLLPDDVDALLTARARKFRADLWRKAPELGAEFDAIAPLYTEAGEQRTKTAAAAAATDGFNLGVATSAAAVGVPAEFHQALRDGADACAVTIDGLDVAARLSAHGTDVPNPASGPAWHALVAVVRRVAAGEYTCADIVASDLPREIRDARWTDTHSRPVHVMGHPVRRKARKSRWRPFGVAAWLLPAGWMAAMCGRVGPQSVALAATFGTATVGVATVVAMEIPGQTGVTQPRPPTISQEGYVSPRTKLISTVSPAPTPKPTAHPGAQSRQPSYLFQSPSPTPPPAAPAEEPTPEVPVDSATPPAREHGHGPKVDHIDQGHGRALRHSKTDW